MRFLLFFVLSLLCIGSAAQISNEAEHIISFHSQISLLASGEIDVHETITVRSTGEAIKRGIFRSLPTVNNNRKDVGRRLVYEITEVKKNGRGEKYHTENKGGNYILYIGDKNIFLDPGVYTYTLGYKVKNQVAFLKDYDELYWNVNGNSWNFSADSVSATVLLPEGAETLQQSCYTAVYGKMGKSCSSRQLSDRAYFWWATGLEANEGLTIAIGFNKGIISPPPLPGYFEQHGVKIFSALTMLSLIIFCFYTWKKFGVDPPKPVVYPQFNVPQNFSPAVMGMVLKEKFDNDFFVAAIVHLAVKGYIRIEEVNKKVIGIFNKKSYTLQRLKPVDEDLPAEEKILLNGFFSEDGRLNLEPVYDEKIKKIYDNFKSTIKNAHGTLLNKGRNLKLTLVALSILIWAILFLSSLVIGLGLKESVGAFMLVFVIIPMLIVQNFIDPKKYRTVMFVLAGFVISMGSLYLAFKKYRTGYFLMDSNNILWIAGFLLLAIIVVVLYGYYIKRPAEEKLRLQSLIKGFGMYLGTAEEKQLQHFNPPEVTPEVFENLLPYAMVLGVDKIWGEKFENYLKAAVSLPQYQNSWYMGQSFSPTGFGKTFNSSFGSVISSSVTPPSSSGSGGSSGGGFSGGGGGGGGGGGW